jgi:hypothetical protein
MRRTSTRAGVLLVSSATVISFACSSAQRDAKTDSAPAGQRADTSGVPSARDTAVAGPAKLPDLPDSVGHVRGDTLELRLTNGEEVSLVSDRNEGETAIEYTYAGIIGRRDYYLVLVHYYESVGYEMIDASTGERQKIVGRPVISPSGDIAVAAAYNIGISEGPDAIEIWRLVPHPAQALWSLGTTSYRVGGWGASVTRWSGDSAVLMTRHILLPGHQDANGDFPELKRPMRLVRRAANWIVDTTAH